MSAEARGRWDHIDWLRGLAVLAMFQTHLYDAFVRDADRTGNAWWSSRHIGGFPARLFLFLAGVSLVLRWHRDARAALSDAVATRGAVRRGLEVLALGLAFRVVEWTLGGAPLDHTDEMLRVDILNTIGVSLVVCALVCRPSELRRRLPWVALGATAIVILGTPFVELSPVAAAQPRWLFAYVAGEKPLAYFPLFPWAGYTFAGVACGAIWLRASARGRLAHLTLGLASLGVIMAIVGQILRDPRVTLWSFGDNQARVTGPNAFLYRTGVVLALVGVAFLVTRFVPAGRFSPLRILGKTSLLTYWIHVELVYGHATKSLYHQLSLGAATVALVLLLLSMLALAWWRLEHLPGLLERARSRLRRIAEIA